MSFTIITERITETGTTYNQEFRCKDWCLSNGMISFLADNGDTRLISVHKMDNILVKEDPEVKPHGY
jgi:hypothetical protein